MVTKDEIKIALDYLEKENRKVPLISFDGVWTIEEMEYFLQEVTEKDRRSFHTVAIALNEGKLDLEEFLKLNELREEKLKEEVVKGFKTMINNSGGDLVISNENIMSLARHYMNEHVVPKIEDKSHNTFFICVGNDPKLGTYASILDSKQLSEEEAFTIFFNRDTKSSESLVKVFIDFDQMEYHTKILM